MKFFNNPTRLGWMLLGAVGVFAILAGMFLARPVRPQHARVGRLVETKYSPLGVPSVFGNSQSVGSVETVPSESVNRSIPAGPVRRSVRSSRAPESDAVAKTTARSASSSAEPLRHRSGFESVQESGYRNASVGGHTHRLDFESVQVGIAPVPIEKHYSVPLVYRLEDEEFLAHFPQVTPEVMDSLRAEFEMNAGVGELEPDDPEYGVRWEHAEMSLQDRIRTLYGWAAWGDYERQAALQAEADRVAALNK